MGVRSASAAAVTAPRRQAGLCAAAAVAGYLMVSAEVLSVAGGLNRAGVLTSWLVGGLAGAIYVGRRSTRSPSKINWRLSVPELLLVIGIGVLLIGEFVLAILSAPNNYDSLVYHLPRIERWVANGDVGPFATSIHRQVDLAPGGEYLLLHLRLATGDDRLYNLVQWSAQLLVLVAVSRIAAQLGGGRLAQLLAVFIAATCPMVVLQASSTQNDLLTAAWVTTLATLVLDQRFSWAQAGWIGLVTALILQTKAVGLFAAAPLLLWWGLRVARRRGLGHLAGAAAIVIGFAAAIAGPFLGRTWATFGSPLGPAYLSDSVGMHRHDPPALIVNGLRIGATLLQTPFGPLESGVLGVVTRIAGWLRVDLNDPAITFVASRFPQDVHFPYEDQASYPITALLGGVAVLVALMVPRWLGGPAAAVRRYGLAILVAAGIYCLMISWQQWGNRLVLNIVLLTTPLAGLGLHRLAARWRPAGAALTVLVLLAAGFVGGYAVVNGRPRALLGQSSPFVRSDWEQLFVVPARQREQFEWVAGEVLAVNPGRIGLVEFNNALEYPWWQRFPGRTLVPLQSLIPGHPAPRPDQADLDALVCSDTLEACRRYTPAGWTLHWRYGYGYALPPR